jgi:archaellin
MADSRADGERKTNSRENLPSVEFGDRRVLSRRSLLVASGVGLTAGCLRLSNNGSTAGPADETTDDGGSTTETTDDETTDGDGGQSGRLQVVSASGLVGSSGDSVAMVTLVVKLAPGSGEIDLTTLLTEMISSDTTANFTHASRGESPVYYVEPVVADDTSDAVLTSEDDRYTLKFPLGSIPSDSDPIAVDPVSTGTNDPNADLSPLGEGASATLTLSPSGAEQTEVQLVVPQTLAGSSAVAL